jgi:carbon starvation protein CstA
VRCEADVKPIGYGAMLLESMVAVFALACVMILLPGSEAAKGEKKASQQLLIEHAERRFKQASALKKRKPKGISTPEL